MRSSIFDPSPKRLGGGGGSSRAAMFHSRANSASPNLKASTKIDSRKSSKPYKELDPKSIPTFNFEKGKKQVPWNIEEMLNAYHDYKLLPPMLSPTLPARLFDTTPLPELEHNPLVTSKSDITDIPLAQLTPRGLPVKQWGSNYIKSNDKLTSANPTESSSSNQEIGISKPKSKKAKVKWVNRMDEDTPRFLIRFLYNHEKYLKSRPKSKSTNSTTGLGISVNDHNSKKSGLGIKLKDNTPESSISTSSTPIPTDGRPKQASSIQKDDDDYIKHKTYWIKLAKETKFMASQTEGMLSLIIELDSLVLFTISYDYDDKLKTKMKIPPMDRYWYSLIDEVKNTIQKIESVYLTIKKYEPIKNYLRCFVSILHKFVIIILQRSNTIYEKLADNESEISKKFTWQNKILDNHKIIEEIYRTSEIICPNLNLFVKANFPQIWLNRCKNLADFKPNNKVVPVTNNYYLPLSLYSTISEFVSFFHHLITAFIPVYNNIFRENLIYSLKSGQSV